MNILRALLFVIAAIALAGGAEDNSNGPEPPPLRAEKSTTEAKASIIAVIATLLNEDLTRSSEIAAKYDLREQKNAHWANIVNANPNQSVIDQMVVIDLDGDNDEDLLVPQIMNPRGDPALYRELEMVIFRNTTSGFVMEQTGISVNMTDSAVDDFNADGLQDIFIANLGFDDEPFLGGQSRLILQNDDGTLRDVSATNIPASIMVTHGACSGDFDADGDADLFLAVVNMEHALYENDGLGVFTDSTATILPPEVQPTPNPEASFQFCESGDFDLDGRDDLVLGQQDIGRPESDIRDTTGNVLLDSIVVLYGSDMGALETDYTRGLLPVTWDSDEDSPQVVDIKVADFDLDNCLDVVASSATGGSVGQVILDPASNFAVHFGDCNGAFSDPINYTQRPTFDSANTLGLTDFNDDGFPDFVNRYNFDPYLDGGLEVPPVADADYHPRAYINNQSLTDAFTIRELTRSDVEQLEIIGFLGLIHNNLP